MKSGIELIAEERQRQIVEEQFTIETDVAEYQEENICDLVLAASCYALPHEYREVNSEHFIGLPKLWPWDASWWKPTPENRVRELQKAGALIAAEIDRLQTLNKHHDTNNRCPVCGSEMYETLIGNMCSNAGCNYKK